MDAQLTMGLDEADLVLAGEDLARDEGLVTAVLVSLFSDRRADESDLDDPTDDPRGWWAEDEGDRHGSLLWLLERAKALPATAARAREYAEQALAWLVEERIARRVEVEATYVAQGLLQIRIRIHRAPTPRWSHLWDGTAGLTRTIGGLLLALEVV